MTGRTIATMGTPFFDDEPDGSVCLSDALDDVAEEMQTTHCEASPLGSVASPLFPLPPLPEPAASLGFEGLAEEDPDEEPSALMRLLVDVRSRLDKVSKDREGRARLMDKLLHNEGDATKEHPVENGEQSKEPASTSTEKQVSVNGEKTHSLAEMDRRLGELETVVGSSTTSLDEVRRIFLV